MLFKEIHQQMILKGTKTATRRVWKKPMVKVGGIYKCKLRMLSKNYFAKIKVTKLYKQKLMDMRDGDANKEGYPTVIKFKDIWVDINKEWLPYLEVDVVEFKVVKC